MVKLWNTLCSNTFDPYRCLPTTTTILSPSTIPSERRPSLCYRFNLYKNCIGFFRGGDKKKYDFYFLQIGLKIRWIFSQICLEKQIWKKQIGFSSFWVLYLRLLLLYFKADGAWILYWAWILKVLLMFVVEGKEDKWRPWKEEEEAQMYFRVLHNHLWKM